MIFTANLQKVYGSREFAAITSSLDFKVLKKRDMIFWLQTCFRIEEAGLVGCCAVWLGDSFPMSQRNPGPSSSGL